MFVIAAPEIVDLYTFGKALNPASAILVVDLLRFFAPQLFFYGAISLMSALLATRDQFAVVGFVPVINNVIGIIVLVAFHAFFHAPENPANGQVRCITTSR